MGNHPRGILCYGIRICHKDGSVVEEGQPDWLNDNDYIYDYIERLCYSAPKGIINIKSMDVTPEQLESFRRQWHAMVSGVENSWKTPILQAAEMEYHDLHTTNRDFDIELISHCYSEYSMYILAIRSSVSQAYDGDVFSFDDLPKKDPTWDNVLESFCIKGRIPFSQPKWYLTSYYG